MYTFKYISRNKNNETFVPLNNTISTMNEKLQKSSIDTKISRWKRKCSATFYSLVRQYMVKSITHRQYINISIIAHLWQHFSRVVNDKHRRIGAFMETTRQIFAIDKKINGATAVLRETINAINRRDGLVRTFYIFHIRIAY